MKCQKYYSIKKNKIKNILCTPNMMWWKKDIKKMRDVNKIYKIISGSCIIIYEINIVGHSNIILYLMRKGKKRKNI